MAKYYVCLERRRDGQLLSRDGGTLTHPSDLNIPVYDPNCGWNPNPYVTGLYIVDGHPLNAGGFIFQNPAYFEVKPIGEVIPLDIRDGLYQVEGYIRIREITNDEPEFSQAVLGEVAKTNQDHAVRYAAVKRITDQAVLGEVVKTAQYLDVRLWAIERITEQASLEEMARTNQDPRIRLAAIDEITNEAVLAEFAKTSSDQTICIAAVKRIGDDTILAEVAKTSPDQHVRDVAIKRIINSTILATVVINS